MDFLIVDCSRPGKDVARHRAEGLIIEVDYQTAKQVGMLRNGRAKAVIYGYYTTTNK